MTIETSEIKSGSDLSCQASLDHSLKESELLKTFDQFVKNGLVQYDYSFTTEIRLINGIRVSYHSSFISYFDANFIPKFEFRISKALQHKPSTVHESVTQNLAKLKPRPGSDINTIGTELCTLGEAHVLAFNGFSSYRPHYLIITADGYKKQREPLDIQDFRAIREFLDNNDYLVFYNCKPEASCSRDHKHLQAIPKSSFDGEPWFNLDHSRDALPFIFYERKFTQEPTADAMSEVYNEGLQQVERSLGLKTTEEDGAPPHNMVMDKERMFMVPRRKAGIGRLGANSCNMLGMIQVKSEEAMHEWIEAGPDKIMAVGGVPKPDDI
ncbi:ATP adenylyltransferase C-terminal [Fusarium beomiforme]|uniref:ATP adenylyltransferase C-terminal n=1 Tax=Fusarium beomiforme TaxID=44412 RepID=A0A9P5DWK2_9HYPO|nr:ATP adenylyltransferase C-terminal [Fusarium beomiforme]